jgi:hypothetical protein
LMNFFLFFLSWKRQKFVPTNKQNTATFYSSVKIHNYKNNFFWEQIYCSNPIRCVPLESSFHHTFY